jgi:hypothetical protein
MPPAPARAQVIRPVADDRVAQRIDDQRGNDGDADQARIQPDDLAVKQQQEVVETTVVDAVGDGTEAIGGLDADRQWLGLAR